MANTLAYYDTATITAIKSFIVQAPGSCKHSILIWSHFLVPLMYDVDVQQTSLGL